VEWRFPLQLFAALHYRLHAARTAARCARPAGESGVAYVQTGRPRDGSQDYYGLYVDGDEVAHAEFHGAWIEWLA
jgi:hypothetical protein